VSIETKTRTTRLSTAGLSKLESAMVQLLAYLVLAFISFTLASSAQAQTRVDLFDRNSRRTGSATIDERTGRVDFYDTQSRRTGYGTIAPSGKVETFDLRGKRTGSGTLTPSGGAIREPDRR
jgi:hypothetical protein